MNRDRSELMVVASDANLAQELVTRLAASGVPTRLPVATSAGSARKRIVPKSVGAILLDESAVAAGESLPGVVAELARLAPVVVLADPRWQAEIAPLAARGEADFVARVGNFVPLVVSLLERRLRGEPAGWKEEALPAELTGDFAEVLRHELNNPLTGILGNAELLLAGREQMTALDLRRLETIAELAVRLRETVRRLSNDWESRQELARMV